MKTPERIPFNIEDVVERGMCVGCGACEIATRGSIFVSLDELGKWSAELGEADGSNLDIASTVCPFSDLAANEDVLGGELWPGLTSDARTGRWRDAWAGRIADDGQIMGSSSGGLTTYVLEQLLIRGTVDAVIHVGRASGGHFEYQISATVSEVRSRRKSDYTAVTLASVLESVRGDGRKYALVGLPCFIRGARLLAERDSQLKAQITTFVGLVCGHLKTRFFAESLAWQAGIDPDDLDSFDFRVKEKDRPSSRYSYSARQKSTGEVVTRRMSETVDGSWGHGAFQPEACNFCDDIFAETADVVFGDAWLPKYTSDWRGTNVALSRSSVISTILVEGAENGDIHLDTLTLDEIVESQAGNFRHRRDGLRVRLQDDRDAGLRTPTKRFKPGVDHVTPARLRLIRKRRAMSAESLRLFAEAKRKGDLSLYIQPMRRLVLEYKRVEVSWLRRRLRWAARVLEPLTPTWVVRVTARWRLRG